MSEDAETKGSLRSVMNTVATPHDISVTETPQGHQDSGIDPDRSVYHSTQSQINYFLDKGCELYLLFYPTKVLRIPKEESRLSTIRFFKSPADSHFILTSLTSVQFYVYAYKTEVFVEKRFGKSYVDAVKASQELLNGFCATYTGETEPGVVLRWSDKPSISENEEPGKTKNPVRHSQDHEQQVLKTACRRIAVKRIKGNKHHDPDVYPRYFYFVPSVGNFPVSRTKAGSQVKQNVKKKIQMTGAFENEKLKESKCSVKNEKLKESVNFWKWKLHDMHKKLELERTNREKLARELLNKTSLLDSQSAQIAALKKDLQKTRAELAETLLQLGQLSCENEKMIQEKKRGLDFRAMFKSNVSIGTQTRRCIPTNDESTFAQNEQVFGANASAQSRVTGAKLCEELPLNNITGVSVQETAGQTSPREWISLSFVPTTAVEISLYNKYKLLLFIIESVLLSDEVTKLKEWARNMLSVNVLLTVGEIFVELDKRGIISSSNLNLLKHFFEKIIRFDLVYLIDCFLCGDYSRLQQANKNLIKRSASIDTRPRPTPVRSSGVTYLPATSASGNAGPPSAMTKLSPTVDQTKLQDTLKSSNVPDDQQKIQGFQKDVHRNVICDEKVTYGCRRRKNDATNGAEHRAGLPIDGVGKADIAISNQPSPPVNHGRGSRYDMGSNGKKLSKFQRPDTAHNRRPSPRDCVSDDDDESQWLCNHYKRRCYVKFDCCNKYWPCHRCHNNKSNCVQKKLKSRDTTFIKCVKCGTEQQFNEGSQFCIQCKTRLAKYFCFMCKHLTGTDDHPYHCDKCGICRIHGDRSFHCDVCGVCLDVQLKGNHKCRAGSAHDECCICLEDAFTGCQILPCSHKVHKECATQMIRSGITRCPICRESFAHKLERRSQPQKKPTRKKITR